MIKGNINFNYIPVGIKVDTNLNIEGSLGEVVYVLINSIQLLTRSFGVQDEETLYAILVDKILSKDWPNKNIEMNYDNLRVVEMLKGGLEKCE